jgi:hypothetical protein
MVPPAQQRAGRASLRACAAALIFTLSHPGAFIPPCSIRMHPAEQ